jgi:hypothetical protein
MYISTNRLHYSHIDFNETTKQSEVTLGHGPVIRQIDGARGQCLAKTFK